MVEHQPRLLGSRFRFPWGVCHFFPFLPKLHFQLPFLSPDLSFALKNAFAFIPFNRPSKKKVSCLSSPTAPIFLPDRDFFLFFILRKTGIREGRHMILVHSIEMSKKVVEKESRQVSLSTVSSPLGGPLHAYGRQTCSSRVTVQDQFSPSVITAQLRRTLQEEHGKEIQQFSLSTVSCPFGCLHTRAGAKHVPVDLQYSTGFVLP